MTGEIILVRHGKTAGNEHGLLHGRTDLPLAEQGFKESLRVADQLRQLGEVKAIYSSPLQRARTTATIIGQKTGLTPLVDPDLSEFDFGDLEGLSFDDLQVQYPEVYLSLIDPGGFNDPFPNGESRRAIFERVSLAMERITTSTGQGRIVVVAHLIVIATAIARLTTGNPHDAIRYLVHNCSISRLEMRRNGRADLLQFNDVTHLKSE